MKIILASIGLGALCGLWFALQRVYSKLTHDAGQSAYLGGGCGRLRELLRPDRESRDDG